MYYRPEKQPAGDTTLLNWACARLERLYPACVARVPDDAAGWGKLGALCSAAQALSPPPRTLICCNLEAAFLPADVFARALEVHRSSGVDCTRVGGLPRGVSIECFEYDALRALKSLSPYPGETEPSVLIARLVLDRLTGGASRFTIATCPSGIQSSLGELIVETRWHVELAARVAASGEDDLLACWMRLSAEPPNMPVFRPPSSANDGLRVLFFSAHSGFSGAETALASVVGAMSKVELEASAFIPMDGLFAERMRLAGCHVNIFETNIDSPTPENLEVVARLVDAVKPQVIHLNSPGGRAAVSVAEARGIPCVQHLRVTDMSRFADVSDAVTAKIAVSNYVKSLAGNHADVHVIPDGVDTEWFAPAPLDRRAARRKLRLPDGALVFLVAARLDPQKRHDLLIESFNRVVSSIPESILLVAGDDSGDPGWTRHLDGKISELGLQSAVKRLGFVNDLRPIYAAADAYVACGEGEALGCAALEAMSMELPVILSDHGGQSEVVEPERSGVVFPAGDASMLASQLLSMRDVELRRELGLAARRRVQDYYSLEKAADQTLFLLSSLAGR